MAWMNTSEELFLRLFKGGLLIVMWLALFGVVVSASFGTVHFLGTPKEPAPAKEPPASEIKPDQFLAVMKSAAEPKQDTNAKGTQRSDPLLEQEYARYLKFGKELAACSREFSKAVNPESSLRPEDEADQAELLANHLQGLSRQHDLERDWGPAVVAFTCNTLKNTGVLEFRKNHAKYSVLIPAIEFHRRRWQEDRVGALKFRENEQLRIEQERQSEEIRVATKKAQGLTLLGVAGGFAGLFALLAFYLLFAKIETNLRSMAEAAGSAGR